MGRFRPFTTNISRAHIFLLSLLVWGGIASTVGRGRTADPQHPSPRDLARDPHFARRLEARESVLSVGTDLVRLYFSGSGEWLGMIPSWGDGRSLFEEGGIFVLASSEESGAPWMVTTAGGTFLPNERRGVASRCCEGVKGGNRAPAPNPDDDNDGRVDEDRLDGIDNDGDGQVDEDFAAIGDEMIVTRYRSPGNPDALRLDIHQETYGWALPHIDGMIAMRLVVENTGQVPIRDLRIGAFLRRQGPYEVSEATLANRPVRQADPEHARAIICGNPFGSYVGLLFPDHPRAEGAEAEWTVWASNPGVSLDAVLGGIAKGRAGGVYPPKNGSVPAAPPIYGALEDARTEAGEEAFTGGISPKLGDLAPGDGVEIVLAIVSVPERDGMMRALENAHRTYLGDGSHRFIPPPVPMTPHVVSGTYRLTDALTGGLVVTIECALAESFCPAGISFMSNIDLNDLEIVAETSRSLELLIRGESAARLLENGGEKIILKGRDETGRFFDALLRPIESGHTGGFAAPEDGELFWQTAGKLPEQFLSGSPNPFREQTTLFFEVPSVLETEEGVEIRFWGSHDTSIKIYDVTGRLVSVLVEETYGPGFYQTDWRAVDEYGDPVASGVYYVKLQIGKRYITKRLILLK